jgi:hypothetical protein
VSASLTSALSRYGSPGIWGRRGDGSRSSNRHARPTFWSPSSTNAADLELGISARHTSGIRSTPTRPPPRRVRGLRAALCGRLNGPGSPEASQPRTRTARWSGNRLCGLLRTKEAYLNAGFTESQGQVSGSQLFLEIRARGYRGSRQVVRKHLAALRAGTAEPVRDDIPSPRKITSWIMRPRETLTESRSERLLPVRLACPDITRACGLARAFAVLVRPSADTCCWSGSGRPSRTHRSR